MFSKLFTSAALVLALSLQVNAHAAIAPALGVAGAPVRNDVQRPSAAAGCGKVNAASTIDTSTPVVADATGKFTVTVTNFNAGADGSRQVSATVDPTGAGKTFSGTVAISANGVAAPASTGSDQVTATLPAGTVCSGGASGKLCLVSFKTSAGFGNCVVVQQGGAAAAAGAGTAAATAATGAAGTAAAGTGGAAAAGAAAAAAKKGKAAKAGAAATGAKAGKKAKAAKAAAAKAATAAKAARNVGGTRAARALLNGVNVILA